MSRFPEFPDNISYHLPIMRAATKAGAVDAAARYKDLITEPCPTTDLVSSLVASEGLTPQQASLLYHAFVISVSDTQHALSPLPAPHPHAKINAVVDQVFSCTPLTHNNHIDLLRILLLARSQTPSGLLASTPDYLDRTKTLWALHSNQRIPYSDEFIADAAKLADALPRAMAEYMAERIAILRHIREDQAFPHSLTLTLYKMAGYGRTALHGQPAAWDKFLLTYRDLVDPNQHPDIAYNFRRWNRATRDMTPFAGYTRSIIDATPAALMKALKITNDLLAAEQCLWEGIQQAMAGCSDHPIRPTPPTLFRRLSGRLLGRKGRKSVEDLFHYSNTVQEPTSVRRNPLSLLEVQVTGWRSPEYVSAVDTACLEANQSPLDAAIFFDETRRMNQKGVIAGLLDIQNRINSSDVWPERLRGKIVGLMHSITSDELVCGGHNTLNLNLIEALYKLSSLPERTWESYNDPRWLSSVAVQIRDLFSGSSYATEENQLVFALGCFLASETLASQIEFPAFESRVAGQLSNLTAEEKLWVTIHADQVEDRHKETALKLINESLLTLGRDPSTDPVLRDGFTQFQNLLLRFYQDQRRPTALPIMSLPSCHAA